MYPASRKPSGRLFIAYRGRCEVSKAAKAMSGETPETGRLCSRGVAV